MIWFLWVLSTLSGACLVGLMAYVVYNDSGHTGFEPRLLAVLFAGTAAASLLVWWKRRRTTPAIVLAGLLGLAGCGTLLYLDQTNALVEYNRWIRRGMPPRGEMSNQATPVNAPTASRFQVERPYRRVPE